MENRFNETRRLEKHFSNRARKATRVGPKLMIPLPFQDDGKPVMPGEAIPTADLSLKEARFLYALHESQGDVERSLEVCKGNYAWMNRFMNSERFRRFDESEERMRKVAEEATPTRIKAELMKGMTGEVERSEIQFKHLSKLADIVIPKKDVTVNVAATNIWNLPTLSPDVEAKMAQIANQALDAEVISEEKQG